MEPFDLIRFFARCLQFVGIFTCMFSPLPLWRGNPLQACLLVFAGIAAWAVGSRVFKWAVESDPAATPFISQWTHCPPQDNNGTESLLGREGKVVTPLRPFGCLEIDGRNLEVVSEQEYIPAGEIVKIVARKGKQLVVRPCTKIAPPRQ
jgi:membrane-bound ClpP family serine protease